MLSYSLSCNYKIVYPPQHYPSAAPYAALTKFFYKLIKEKVIHNRLLKQLLYPEYLNKMNLSLVKIRHHKTECVIMTKASDCRFSIVKCDSDSEDNSSDSENPGLPRQNAVEKHSSSDGNSSSSSNPFGYIRYYNPQTETECETKYSSFIDYGEPVHSSEAKMVEDDSKNKKASITVTSTAKVQLVHQTSESSDASSHIVPKPYLACEDLVNIDEDLPVGIPLRTRKLYVPTTRQSLPTKFVGNKFSQTSLTTVDIPQWQSNSDNQLNCRVACVSSGSPSCVTTHSSSLDLHVNTLPLPDKMVAELLYNFDSEKPSTFTKSESMDSDKSFKTVIKPPTVFQNLQEAPVSLSLENVGFHKHSINSDKPKRRSSIHMTRTSNVSGIRRCVSSHFVQMNRDLGCSDTACCMELCHSPRSSDSGMAGSCTLNSPDFGAADQERCSMDLSNDFLKRDLFGDCSNALSLSEMEARDFNSQCPCTSPFGSTPRTSCETPVSENIISVPMSNYDLAASCPWEITPKIHSKLVNVSPMKAEPPRCIEQWEPAHKSKSLDSLSSKPNVSSKIDDSEPNNEKGEVFKSGLYAHWWLKAKIPASVVKGIYEETRSPNTGKGF